MSSPIRSVTVYCSSSTAIPRVYFDAASALGAAIAKRKWTLVYGGNFVGLMAAVAQGARDAGGKVVGVTPQLMVDKGLSDGQADELLVTNTMRDRKALMEERGDSFVALPGGLGTFEASMVLMLRLAGIDLPVALSTTLLFRGLSFWLPMLPGWWLAHRAVTPSSSSRKSTG